MTAFRNSYLIMRHGQSEANVAGIVVSDPATGCERFGLTPLGRAQVITSIDEHKEQGFTQIICSDFLRTQQTAELAANTLNLEAPQVDTGLRERFFGRFEGLADIHYEGVWQRDQITGQQTDDKVETTEAVLQRGLRVLQKLEQQFHNQVILLVSHGDMLQILRTAFVDKTPQQHRSLSHHETAEIKHLVSQGHTYPVIGWQ